MCIHKKEIVIPSTGRTMYVNCGQCPSCLQERALNRANKIRLQDSVRDDTINWFITLTYDNKYIPYIRPSEVLLFASGELDHIPLHRDFECYWITKLVNEMVPGKRKALVKSGRKIKKTWLVERSTVVPLEKYTKSDFNYYGYDFDFEMYKQYDFPLLYTYANGQEQLIYDKSSVLYYKDWQNFIKRLRNILIRDYGLQITSDNFKYVCTGEYGSCHHRAHFHGLLSTPSITQDEITQAVIKAWPYADPSRMEHGVERERDASSYIASYVNSNSKCKTFFKYAKPFRSRTKFSEGYAVDAFSVSKIRERFYRRDMHFVTQRVEEGQLTSESVIYPTFIINHWFPRFKGFNRLTSDEIQRIVLRPDILATRYYAERLGFFKRYDQLKPEMKFFRFSDKNDFGRKFTSDLTSIQRSGNTERTMYYSTEVKFEYDNFEGRKITTFHSLIDWPAVFSLIRVLKRRKQDWIENIEKYVDKKSFRYYQLESEYAFMYSYIWSIRASNMIHDHHDELSDNRHYVYFYDNVSEFYDGAVENDILRYTIELMDAEEIQCLPRSPNFFPDNIEHTNDMESWYFTYDKDKRIRELSQYPVYYSYKSKRKVS